MCSITFVTNSKEGLALLLYSALGGLGGFKSNPTPGPRNNCLLKQKDVTTFV